MCDHNAQAIPDPALREAIAKWCSYDWRLLIIRRLAAVVADYKNNENLLKSLFLKRIQFGTAGLRGEMAPFGFNAMNEVTVLQTSQGLAAYLAKKYSCEETKIRGVVIGSDARHNSRNFANIAAAAFLAMGFKVYLFGEVTPTPLTPYWVAAKKCLAGIQITASHNPKADNGYKVYSANGAQIVPPMDAEISASIDENLQRWAAVETLMDDMTCSLRDPTNVIDPYEEAFQSYVQDIERELLGDPKKRELASSTSLKVVYTAMHGVGYPLVEECVRRSGFNMENFLSVPQQEKPDPDFTTVLFPNPEEEGALDLAMALAESENARLVVANDPDADRFACAERQSDGSWYIFHGDELGVLFGVFGLHRELAKGRKSNELLFMCSVVSSQMLRRVAEVEGAHFAEAMTGFKWLINTAMSECEKLSLVPVLIYEEALGYANTLLCPDKDGVSATALWLQEAAQLYAEGKTIVGFLEEIRKKYGYFVTNNSYLFTFDQDAVKCLFNEFRNGGKYRDRVGEFDVVRIRDCTTGFDSAMPDNKSNLPLTPSTQMVTLFFANGAECTLRTSGTEPKLKYYSEMAGSDAESTRAELKRVVDAVVKEIIRPEKYSLVAHQPPPPAETNTKKVQDISTVETDLEEDVVMEG